jgi:hypothetical protein
VLLLILLVIALVGETIWFAPWAGDPPTTSRTPAPLPLADVNPYGVNVFLDKEVDPWKKEQTLNMVQAAGIGWIKQEFPWSELEFKKGVFWDDAHQKSSWIKFDEIMDLAAKHGLRVIARLDRAPAWARQPGSNPEAPPQNLRDFGDFIAAFVQHYQQRGTPVQFLQIWNEPNLNVEWYAGRAVDPAGYVALLKEAAQRARAANPSVMILAAPLATTLDNYPDQLNLNELIYLDKMYQAGAKDAFDIMAANAYGLDRPPEDPPDPNVLNFRRVELLRQVMERNGDVNKAIWFNEYGWNAPDTALVPNPTPGSTAPNPVRRWGTVTLAQQADYTVRGIAWAQQHWPWAGVFTIWYFRQVGDISTNQAEYYFQMVSPDWVAQPVYNRVQAAAQSIQLAGPGTYDELAAPVAAGAGWRLQRDPRAAEGVSLVSTVPSDTIRIRFQGTDLALAVRTPISTTSATAPRLFVTVDGSTAGVAGTLPRDPQGRPYLDAAQVSAGASGVSRAGAVSAAGLDAPVPGEQAFVPVVSGLSNERAPGLHTVDLIPDGPGVIFDGFTVRSARSYLPFVLTTALLLAAILGVGAGLLRGRPATRA